LSGKPFFSLAKWLFLGQFAWKTRPILFFFKRAPPPGKGGVVPTKNFLKLPRPFLVFFFNSGGKFFFFFALCNLELCKSPDFAPPPGKWVFFFKPFSEKPKFSMFFFCLFQFFFFGFLYPRLVFFSFFLIQIFFFLRTTKEKDCFSPNRKNWPPLSRLNLFSHKKSQAQGPHPSAFFYGIFLTGPWGFLCPIFFLGGKQLPHRGKIYPHPVKV